MKEKLLQCTACGQVAAGENPENLKRFLRKGWEVKK